VHQVWRVDATTTSTWYELHEVYTDEAAVKFHEAQPHYKCWTDFKAAGGLLTLTATQSAAVSTAGVAATQAHPRAAESFSRRPVGFAPIINNALYRGAWK
jgi:hypothetical protein